MKQCLKLVTAIVHSAVYQYNICELMKQRKSALEKEKTQKVFRIKTMYSVYETPGSLIRNAFFQIMLLYENIC
jgi:hypothetical protein